MASQQASAGPRRPRLSLQINKTICTPPSKGLRGYPVNPSDPTTFNTLSNVYVTTIERSSALPEPITAINTLQAFSIQTPGQVSESTKVVTPYVSTYPDTPLTAEPISPQKLNFVYPSTMTATPPMSAGAVDANESKVFTFSEADTKARALESPSGESASYRRAAAARAFAGQIPYSHPRSLHSILRNSPLPPRTAIPPPSPRRYSRRLEEKAAKRVEYDSPLEQEITTFKYVRSHIDLLSEDISPNSPAYVDLMEPEAILDRALAFTANEIQDGGQTPGPFEEMRRRMAGLDTDSAVSPASRKRKRPEKKRQWVWTLGQDDDDDDAEVGGAIAALRAQAANACKKSKASPCEEMPQPTIVTGFSCSDVPTPTIESAICTTPSDADDTSSIASSCDQSKRSFSVPSDTDTETSTPTGPAPSSGQRKRDTPIPELAEC